MLARDEDEAGRLVLQWQRRCYPLSAEVDQVQLDSEGYTDKLGVVWQGFREGEEAAVVKGLADLHATTGFPAAALLGKITSLLGR